MDGRISDIEDVMDFFSDFKDDDCDKKITEEDIISDTLNIVNKINGNPLFLYCSIRTLLKHKKLLTETHIKEISNILDIKPEVKEVIKIKEKIVYKERKSKLNNYDDY